MQATLTLPSEFNPASRLQFARGRDYMMRSEKRGDHHSRNSAPGGRPPRRRRKRAGFFYKLLMMLLLLTLWPLGLMMLWRRKLRWGVGTKLLTSVVTLAACVILIGFALTVDTGNPQYTAIQDSVNSFLDTAADTLVDFSDIAAEKAVEVYEGATELGEALWEVGRVHLSNGIDAGIAFTQSVKHSVLELLEKPEAVPAEETDAPAESVDAAEATEAPDAAPAEADSAEAEQAKPAPRPTTAPLTCIVKPAAEATVYYNDDSNCYHMVPSCDSVTDAAEHSFGEAVEAGKRICTLCGAPDEAMLEEEYIVWADENNTAHLTDECSAFTGGWQIIPANQALESEMAGCEECSSDLYLRGVEAGLTIILKAPGAEDAEAVEAAEPAAEEAAVEAAAEPAEAEPAEAEPAEEAGAPAEAAEGSESADAQIEAEPSAQPATAPAVQSVTPKTALKPVGEATVYHSNNGKWYHSFNRCSGMTGGGAYTLAECAETHKQCKACGAPDAALIGQNCLWADDSGLCHTADTCEAFNGKYSLILRDDALAQGAKGCAACGADEYLIPETRVNYPEYVKDAA